MLKTKTGTVLLRLARVIAGKGQWERNLREAWTRKTKEAGASRLPGSVFRLWGTPGNRRQRFESNYQGLGGGGLDTGQDWRKLAG